MSQLNLAPQPAQDLSTTETTFPAIPQSPAPTDSFAAPAPAASIDPAAQATDRAPTPPPQVERRAQRQPHSGVERRQASTERRAGIDRRVVDVGSPTGLERRRGPGRRRTDDRRSAEEGEMTDEQFEFMLAIDTYKRLNNRPFPTWTEILEVVKQLGYRKVAASSVSLPGGSARSQTVPGTID